MKFCDICKEDGEEKEAIGKCIGCGMLVCKKHNSKMCAAGY